MNKKRLANLLKRKLFSLGKIFSAKDVRAVEEMGEKQFIKNQLKDISRFGGDLIVMRMGN